MKKSALKPTEFDSYYLRYINNLNDETELIQCFIDDKITTENFFSSISNEKLEYRYQPNKWTVKEILQHLIDTERIFMHRCFRIARRDRTPISGFDQDIYINPSKANEKSLRQLLKEFHLSREYSINLLKSFSNEDLQFIGNANGTNLSARAAAFVIHGHNIWHINVIKERYL